MHNFYFRTLLDLMISMQVDLIVIEGVGRSIHSNFNAKFKCQSLKLAVIKVSKNDHVQKIEQNFNDFRNFKKHKIQNFESR